MTAESPDPLAVVPPFGLGPRSAAAFRLEHDPPGKGLTGGLARGQVRRLERYHAGTVLHDDWPKAVAEDG